MNGVTACACRTRSCDEGCDFVLDLIDFVFRLLGLDRSVTAGQAGSVSQIFAQIERQLSIPYIGYYYLLILIGLALCLWGRQLYWVTVFLYGALTKGVDTNELRHASSLVTSNVNDGLRQILHVQCRDVTGGSPPKPTTLIVAPMACPLASPPSPRSRATSRLRSTRRAPNPAPASSHHRRGGPRRFALDAAAM